MEPGGWASWLRTEEAVSNARAAQGNGNEEEGGEGKEIPVQVASPTHLPVSTHRQ